MGGRNIPESPLESAAGAAGSETIEALKQLGNETRLAILLALWEAYEPFEDDNALAFSELRERVGMRDKGQFYYHLEKLTGRFVRSSDGCYELRHAGLEVVRTVIAGTGLKQRTLTTTEIDKPCPHCGGPTAIAYEDEWLYQVCTECDGTFAGSDDLLPGTLTVWPFDQAGLSDRTPGEIFVAGTIATMAQYAMMNGGICPDCSGTVDTTLDVCHEHDVPPDGLCRTCDRHYPVQTRFVCTVCKSKMWGPPSILAVMYPRVVAFYANHGLDIGVDDPDLSDITRLMRLVRKHDRAELVSTDPRTIAVTFHAGAEQLRLTLDETLAVCDAEVVEIPSA